MIKHEPTVIEIFNKWASGIRDTCFNSLIFELIDKANLTQLEQIKLGFPEHVKIFEDSFSKEDSQ